MLVYATVTDLTSGDSPWVLDPPSNADQLCRWGSILVSHACQLSLYGEQPTEPSVDVLRDAVCAQVASWIALGVDPAKAGTDMRGPVKSSTILDATVVRDTTAATAQAAEAVKGLCDLAVDLLQTAGLLWLPVPIGAPAGDGLPEWGQGRRFLGPFGSGIDAGSLDALPGYGDWPWPY